MRLTVAAALALICVSTAVSAQDNYSDGRDGSNSFTGLRGSLDFDGHLSSKDGSGNSIKADTGAGGGASIFWGWRLPYGFKTELEVLYRARPLTTATFNGTSAPIDGHANTAGPMVNLYWTPQIGDIGVRPFIGGGLGYLWNQTEVKSVGGITAGKDNSWHFGYDLMAGLSIPMSASTRLTGMYRWLHEDIGVNCGATVSCSAGASSSSVDLGFEMDL